MPKFTDLPGAATLTGGEIVALDQETAPDSGVYETVQAELSAVAGLAVAPETGFLRIRQRWTFVASTNTPSAFTAEALFGNTADLPELSDVSDFSGTGGDGAYRIAGFGSTADLSTPGFEVFSPPLADRPALVSAYMLVISGSSSGRLILNVYDTGGIGTDGHNFQVDVELTIPAAD